ncbi:A/G-specific adenine glycosylase [Sporolactobacillus sp. THM19-2]|nr:A/G-specific adenine glycosylase [Sporolactobacillus sp. THM19-2]
MKGIYMENVVKKMTEVCKIEPRAEPSWQLKKSNGVKPVNPEFIQSFNHDLLSWFHQNSRDLPWRRTKNPYYIWISEIMLQQTQVDTVIPYYQKFIERFPTIEALAHAPEEDVLKRWEGLGYYSRARNLQAGVREVAEKYGAQVPDEKKELLSIRGIGPYTAGALLSMAFGEPEPAIDGNVMRVMSRIFLIDADIARARTRKLFEQRVAAFIAETDPSAFNQSLMDLGAMICRPKNPNCGACPVRKYCKAYEEGVQQDYPVKSRAKKPRLADYAVLLISDSRGRLMIERRPSTGLLAGLWQFPMISMTGHGKGHVRRSAEKTFGTRCDLHKTSFTCTHRFSHLIWNLSLYTGKLDEADKMGNRHWVTPEQLERYPFPVPHQKVIEWMKKNYSMNS